MAVAPGIRWARCITVGLFHGKLESENQLGWGSASLPGGQAGESWSREGQQRKCEAPLGLSAPGHLGIARCWESRLPGFVGLPGRDWCLQGS